MPDQSTQRPLLIAIVCFLGYFINGSISTTVGVLLDPIAKSQATTPGKVSMVFTVMHVGTVVGILLSSYLLHRINIKRLLIILPSCSIVATLIITLIHTLVALGVGLFMMGCVGGILISSSAYLLIRTFPHPKVRSSRLVSADFFFSFAGVTLSSVFSTLFGWGFHWTVAYMIFALMYVLVIIFASRAKFPVISHKIPPGEDITQLAHAKKGWPLALYVIAITAGLFLFAELVLSAWIPTYAHHIFGITLSVADKLVGLYWLSKAIGLFVNQFTVRHMPLKIYLMLSVLIGCASVVVLSYTPILGVFTACVAVAGFIGSGIYGGLISYGSLQLKHPTPFVVTFIIAIATVGALLSTGISGVVYQGYGLAPALHTALFAYFVIVVLMFLSIKLSQAGKLHQPEILSPWERDEGLGS